MVAHILDPYAAGGGGSRSGAEAVGGQGKGEGIDGRGDEGLSYG